MRIAGGPVLRASMSLVVIGLALAGSVGSGAAQYLPPQPPSVSYPPPASHPYPPYDAEAESYPPPASYSYPPYRRAEPPDRYPPHPYPAGRPRYPGAYPYSVPPSQDHGTAVAALPREYQPERELTKELSPRFHRTVVDYPTVEPPGTIIIDTPNTYLYLTIGHG